MKLVDGVPAKRLAALTGASSVSRRGAWNVGTSAAGASARALETAKTNSRAPSNNRPGLKQPEKIPKTLWKMLDFDTKEKLVTAAENETESVYYHDIIPYAPAESCQSGSEESESESAAGGTG